MKPIFLCSLILGIFITVTYFFPITDMFLPELIWSMLLRFGLLITLTSFVLKINLKNTKKKYGYLNKVLTGLTILVCGILFSFFFSLINSVFFYEYGSSFYEKMMLPLPTIVADIILTLPLMLMGIFLTPIFIRKKEQKQRVDILDD